MSIPVSETIAANVLSTMQGITGTVNGNAYTLTAQRHTRAGDKKAHCNAIIVQGDPKEVSDPKVYNTYEWILPFEIGVYVIPLENDNTPIDQWCNIIIADVQKALMFDRYRGNNALDTTIRAAHMVMDEGLQYDIAVINVDVNYRTSELDPYQNAR